MSNIFEQAVEFALKAHEGQRRKDGGVYILHPLEDATIVATMTQDEEVRAAAVRQDTGEETDVTMEEILTNFGERVATLVAHETENKREHLNPSDTWKIRKVESLEVLRTCNDRDTKILWLGDKLSNMRSLAKDYILIGEEVFERFNEKNPREQRWYHETVLSYLTELKENPAYKEYEFLFNLVFDKYKDNN